MSLLLACSGADEPAADETASGVGAGRYVARVVSFTPGPGAGFGQENMPDVVMGPPAGNGDREGGLDVVSLGSKGEITVELSVDAIDGPGADLIVFENAFYVSGNPQAVWKELAEVSVSADGAQWVAFPCDPANFRESRCAGWHPVYSSPQSGVSAFDPAAAGGDAFDLADVGLERVRYVRIRDLSGAGSSPSAGFDLDAVAVVNPAR